MLRNSISRAFIGAAGLAAIVISQPVIAQDALEEVIVTAHKREQSTQEIAAVISVVSGAYVDEFQITELQYLDSYVPGLLISRAPGGFEVSLRGVGTSAGSLSFDQSVSLFVDGAYASRSAEYRAAMYDVSRVEVIKGAQVAYLGKNTSVGAILVETNDPTDDFGGYATGGYEVVDGGWNATGVLNIPFSETIKSRFVVRGNHVGGYMENLATSSDIPVIDELSARVKFTFEPTDYFRAEAMYQFSDRDQDGRAVAIYYCGDPSISLEESPGPIGTSCVPPTGTDLANFQGNLGRDFASDVDGFDEQDVHRATLNMDVDVNGYTISSVTSGSYFDSSDLNDDGSTAQTTQQGTTNGSNEEYTQFTQELRVRSPEERRLIWMGGIFALASEYNRTTDRQGPFSNTRYTGFLQNTTSYQGFFVTDYGFTDRFRGNIGIRYTSEKKNVTKSQIENGTESYPTADLRTSEPALDGAIGLEFDVSDSVMAYFSLSKGTKSGGVAADNIAPDNAIIEAEVANSVEAGLKMELLDNRLVFNIGGFYMDIPDYQFTQFTPSAGGFVATNIDAKTRGFDSDWRWQITDHFNFSGGVTYANAEGLFSYGWDQLERAPTWDGNASLTYETDSLISNWQIGGTVVYSGNTELYQDPPNQPARQPVTTGSDHTFDLLFFASSYDGLWEIRLSGKNITNEEILGFAFPGTVGPGGGSRSVFVGSMLPLRTINLQVRRNF